MPLTVYSKIVPRQPFIVGLTASGLIPFNGPQTQRRLMLDFPPLRNSPFAIREIVVTGRTIGLKIESLSDTVVTYSNLAAAIAQKLSQWWWGTVYGRVSVTSIVTPQGVLGGGGLASGQSHPYLEEIIKPISKAIGASPAEVWKELKENSNRIKMQVVDRAADVVNKAADTVPDIIKGKDFKSVLSRSALLIAAVVLGIFALQAVVNRAVARA